MLYTFPDYYKEFQCTADRCEDTCCAGWAIVIDDGTLKRYRRTGGSLGARLRREIRWKEKVFGRREERCAFLDEENLCDIYKELGQKGLCRTCRLRGEILHCQGQEHCQYHSASQNPAPDPGRTVPFSFCHSLPHFSARRQLLCSLCYHIPADCASGGYFQPFRSAGSVSPAGESSSTRSITNRGRCLTSM